MLSYQWQWKRGRNSCVNICRLPRPSRPATESLMRSRCHIFGGRQNTDTTSLWLDSPSAQGTWIGEMSVMSWQRNHSHNQNVCFKALIELATGGLLDDLRLSVLRDMQTCLQSPPGPQHEPRLRLARPLTPSSAWRLQLMLGLLGGALGLAGNLVRFPGGLALELVGLALGLALGHVGGRVPGLGCAGEGKWRRRPRV